METVGNEIGSLHAPPADGTSARNATSSTEKSNASGANNHFTTWSWLDTNSARSPNRRCVRSPHSTSTVRQVAVAGSPTPWLSKQTPVQVPLGGGTVAVVSISKRASRAERYLNRT